MKIAVAMSGGVDSSVTAAILQEQGHEVFGLTMRLFEPFKTGDGSAVYDAAAVASFLGIEHRVIDLEKPFANCIKENFISEYRSGRTPNPCVRCNREIKFGMLLDYAVELGADMLATGHYVRKTVDPDGRCHLRTAANIAKDQSYFLYTLTQERLAKVIFPLGEFDSKELVREYARRRGVVVSEKGDSQEVCFIPNDDYVAYLEASEVSFQPGDIVHVNGRKIGVHNGIHRYTVGQRKGLGIAWSEPLFVVEVDAAENKIVVGEVNSLFKERLTATNFNWLNRPEAGDELSCKIRYRHKPVTCSLESDDDGNCTVIFTEPQKSVTPGQSVVIYKGDEVLGGGIISR